MSDDRKHAEEEPRTALDEVLREIEDAERRPGDPAGERRRKGEAADAITPNTRAQEESEGE
ncbi:hypothetical protein [Streptomyces sp. NPDC047043]|uniref:hypothetical protein n=1 Tax=Streptomyces sp. NPDC047043 TaxID=3154497 RepID=UPI0033DDF9A9